MRRQHMHVMWPSNVMAAHEPSDNWPAIRVAQPAISASKKKVQKGGLMTKMADDMQQRGMSGP